MSLWGWVFVVLAAFVLGVKMFTSTLLQDIPPKHKMNHPLERLDGKLWTGGESGFNTFHTMHTNHGQINCKFSNNQPFEPGTCFLRHNQTYLIGYSFRSDPVMCLKDTVCYIVLHREFTVTLPPEFVSPLNFMQVSQLITNNSYVLLPSHAIHITATFMAQGAYSLEFNQISYTVSGHFTNLNTDTYSPTTYHTLTLPIALPNHHPDGLIKIVAKDPKNKSPIYAQIQSSFTILQ
ncbi:hypothetical protein DSO57_1007712 [Entomophthora muscae]|uniref:Uncharacterized protein n=1 Tax=Entomophthora muscae TaxID=34485 RepID=A0ACC2SW67_9FUNG|nr:hypothetical protein DSO57_1007712 [Entomophthora muscae]